ncbi:MAG TPA: aminodeoxychorismate synthase component I [Rudaea sp.]|jgi:anthranilate synthase component 1|uniref:aminodeoxychorismate synthase component I n=1 Tax=Rudaea sp. TaxID=2136325 RepID=UPI002F9275C9
MSCVLREAHGVADLLALAAAWPQRYPCLLESAAQASAAQNAALARYDVLFACSGEALTLGSDGRVRDAKGRDRGERFLEALDADWRAQSVVPDIKVDSQSLPFRGGWVLFLGYELGAEIEAHLQRMADSGLTLPVAMALRCPAAIVVDRHTGKTWLVAETECANWLDTMQADLAAVSTFAPEPIAHAQIDEDDPQLFLDGVARIHEYLRAGDVFQVNLSRAWRARFAEPPPPAALYASLRAANPAPFAGLLQWNGWAIASSSPERLVEVHGERVQTRPIAGTRPRFADDDDALRMRELAGHPKERAEHIMLIDLQRNDLGRISVPGSVVVDELMGVESYAHVHHIVSNVRGRLRAGVTPAQVIRAVFPGGTITGAPKVRTMQIITELEGCARGAYTGALGYLNRDGDMDLNILIRTMHMHGSEVRFRAGAGIVADSIALRELEETRAKARGLLRALGASA